MSNNGKPDGRYMSQNALRTASAVDATTNALDGSTFKTASAPINVLGSDMFVTAAAPTAGTTVKVRVAYYDQEDALVSVDDELTLTAGTYKASIKNSSGSAADRFLSGQAISVNPDATFARLVLTSFSAAEAVDFFMFGPAGGFE